MSSTGSIKNLLNKTPKLTIKKTPFSGKFNKSTNFMSPMWNFKPAIVKQPSYDIELIRKTKITGGAIPKKFEFSQNEIMRYRLYIC